MNKCIFTGNLGNKPALYSTSEGKSYIKFNLAVASYNKEKTNWINCILFGDRAKRAHDLLDKGDRITLMAELDCSVYEKDGKKMTSTNFIVDQYEIHSFKTKQQSELSEDEYVIDESIIDEIIQEG